ncbi:A-adding tRNA nucleotidyltransferase [Candidatus Magnetomoraceae bacterium gMMP-1]
MKNEKESNQKNGLTVITTHINSDFDAIASMLAAQKLYPEAKVVFPGSQEKSPRDFFISSMVYLFNMISIKDIDFDKVNKLILVDTRRSSRIGKFADVANRPDVEVHIFDHHPAMADDIIGNYEVCRVTGAAVTILTEILNQKNIKVSAEEATIMCLGLYEDTGSFTFSSTTPEDFLAASFLLSSGANLNTVSDMISREINPQQVGLLNEMIRSTVHHNINGVEILITSVATDNYVGDFAFLVHKLMKMENSDALFALGFMGTRIYLVGRSRIPEVDAGGIIKVFGGGGHPFAASATIKGVPLVETQKKLVEVLYQQVQSRQAKQLMSSPAITTEPNTSVKNAAQTLIRYNVNALLVMEKKSEKLLGLISRQVLEKLMYHKLDYIAVSEYMTTELESVDPDANLKEIQDKIIGDKQRILPVIVNDQVIGVITRTDILKVLISHSERIPENPPDKWEVRINARTRKVVNLMKERLSDRIIQMLNDIGKIADETKTSAYAVGGFVRDLLLNRKNDDIDIVVEGDGIGFAKKYASMVNARINSHKKFGTAIVIFPDGFKLDIASARMEYYRCPAALPTVEKSSLKLDLYRRDFTINTLVIQLNTESFGTLIDFFGSYQDVKGKNIRVLHNLSFIEDPTRVFRAIRFEQRFGFKIGKLTSGLIKNSVKRDFVKQLSGRRVFSELKHILEEENPLPALKRMHEYNLINIIHPSIKFNKNLISLFDSVRKVLAWRDLLFIDETYMKWAVYFMSMIHFCNKETSHEICTRLKLAQRHHNLFTIERKNAERCLRWMHGNDEITNSLLYKNLHQFKSELILYMMAVAKSERVKKQISFYYTQLRLIKIELTGKLLKNMGFEPGPVYSKILNAVLDARLNDEVKTLEEEITFVKKIEKQLNSQ